MLFDPIRDIGSLSGKVIFVTGGTSGIGKATVLALASHHPSQLYFTGRNDEAGQSIRQIALQRAPGCEVTFVKCDLSSTRENLSSILHESFHASRLDIFIANAGIMATPAALSAEGYEVQFATNYLGHAILLRMLRPLILRTAETSPDSDVRVIMLSSFGHTVHPPGGVDFNQLKVANVGTAWQRYGQSKLADILIAKAMAKRYPTITSVSVHPGLVKTNLLKGTERSLMTRFLGMLRWILPSHLYQDADKGAYNTLWAATTPQGNLENGGYYEPVGKRASRQTSVSGAAALTRDENLADRLWEWTEEELVGVMW